MNVARLTNYPFLYRHNEELHFCAFGLGGIVEVVLQHVLQSQRGTLRSSDMGPFFQKAKQAKPFWESRLISLIINVFFKFITLRAFNLSLKPEQRKLLHRCSIPIILLILVELLAKPAVSLGKRSNHKSSLPQKSWTEGKQNDFG